MTDKKDERIEKLIRKRKEEFAKRVKEMEREDRERMELEKRIKEEKKTEEETPKKEERIEIIPTKSRYNTETDK